MRNRSSTRLPLVLGTRATPYGFTSPFAGMVVLIEVMVFNVAMEEASAAKALPSATVRIEKIVASTRMRRESMQVCSIFVLLGYVHTILRDQSSAFSCRGEA